MENIRLRAALRTQFTKNANKLNDQGENKGIIIENLGNIYAKLEKVNEEVQKQILEREDYKEDMILTDLEECEKYSLRWLEIKNSTATSSSANSSKGNIRLPKIDIPKFDGQLKNWMPFWSQFKKIHEEKMDDEDKFVYLVQAMAIESEAKSLVGSYPITAENYPKCVEHLKSRYGREDLQIQVYVRELLGLVLQKASGDGIELAILYDQLSAHLRALETLGVTEKHAAFLLPLVESSLPQETLKAWQRANKSTNMNEELNNLLEFLQKEIENEQRIKMINTFSQNHGANNVREVIPTANCLATTVKTDQKSGCIWCDKEGHSSIECYKLQKLSIDQRKEIVRQKRACTICLKKGHFWKNCRASVRCLICDRRHSTTLCTANKKTSDVTNNEPLPPENKTTAASSSTQGTTLLQTVMVEIQYKDKKVQVRALFDSGSQKTYIKQDIIEKLQIPVTREEMLTHNLFGGIQTASQLHKVYNIEVRSLDSKFKINLEALERLCVCTNVPNFNSNDTVISGMLKSHKIMLTDKGDSTDIGLLIGADFSGLLMTGTIIPLQNGLVAIKTKLGWTLQGKQVGVLSNMTISMFCSELTGYWDLETLGIQDPVEAKSKAAVAEEVLASFEESVKINEENRYEVRLPFKVGREELLSNFERAKQRLESTTRKLVAEDKFKEYHEVLKDWHQAGIIEKVPPSQVDHDTGHYLPHRAVIKESSLTSSLRPVFDASAKDKNGLCLNACLEKGTNLIDLIPNLLVGFRTGAIGITADIQKAFLQISIPSFDRDYLKFLWWENEDCNNIVVYRHCRVVFGLTCSPFLLSATLIHYLNNITGEHQWTAQLLKKSWYVDNCLTSLDTEEETIKFIEESKQIMNKAKFNLRMWVTSPLKLNETGKDIIPVLGLCWDTSLDQLFCGMENLPVLEDMQNLTKRDLLSLTQKIFDPIGFTSPVMLTPKLIIQETWKRGMSWDTVLPADLMKKFHDWYKHIKSLKDCKIPRRLTKDILKECKVSLHLFCDASKDGYAAGVLLRAEKDNQVTTQLISAKSRVTPPKKTSIPRLELLAALIGTRLLTQARENLKLQNCPEYCWTDSGVTLCWIIKQLPLNTFVGNRIKEIRQHTNINNWHHIPGEHNWADLASRGCNARTLLEIRWWEGPAWLRLDPEQWPQSDFTVDELQVHLETKKSVCNAQVCSNESLLDKIQYFSKYSKIIRMVAWIIRFTHNTQHAQNKRKGEITYNEYSKAEKIVIRLIQKENSEINEKRSRHLTQYLDEEGLLRIKTKLTISDFPDTTKAPYLLWAKNPIVSALVRQRHEQLQHVGANQLIVDLRAKFWIIGIRRLVKSVISACVICKRYRAKATQAPTAPLPPERIKCSAPFQATGVDLAGPLILRNGEKCWIVLYTCAVYRAVHLELTRSLSTEAFIMTLRRFVARRGRADLIMSDQGTNFHGTKNLISSLDWEEVQRNSTIRRMSWKMNAPSAAWWGGFWERLIKIMKDLLRRILGKASVSYDELETIICECEAIMNGRPLTYINDDSADCLEPLTPAHFIQSTYNTDMSDFDCINNNSLNKRYKYLQEIREQFKLRFKNEYLTLLVQKGKEIKDIIKIGDIVLIETEEKRIRWPLGIVLDLFTGKDGIERTARVRTATGTKIRPVQRLYKLEISTDPTGDDFPLVSRSPICLTPECDDEHVLSSDLHQRPQQSTRCGRTIKMPSKFDIYM